MLKIGITGQNGFIGWHLQNTILLYKSDYELVEFERGYFFDDSLLDGFVKKCDVIFHLAAINRDLNEEVLYLVNVDLVERLISSLIRTGSRPHIVMSSSTQEEYNNAYGRSKRIGREKFVNWSKENNGKFTGVILPNIFGPFCQPNYNSVIATFSYKLVHGEKPLIKDDKELNFIYVEELISELLKIIENELISEKYIVQATSRYCVSKVLNILMNYQYTYMEKNEIPEIKSAFELNLFNTFRSYLDIANFYPRKFIRHADQRGAFVEIARCGIQGQTSFSTTLPGVTRGNHFHTRKIERFAVIKGQAQIQLRRIGTEEVINFFLDGENLAYVDMPIWYTHNIKNVGTEDLYTIFWINEPYNPEYPDTYFLEV